MSQLLLREAIVYGLTSGQQDIATVDMRTSQCWVQYYYICDGLQLRLGGTHYLHLQARRIRQTITILAACSAQFSTIQTKA
jgi:hypothetical protein